MATPKKKHLIELMIEAGVKWPDGAEYAAQDKSTQKAHFYKCGMPVRGKLNVEAWTDKRPDSFWIGASFAVALPSLCRNWHQTIVTREQYADAVAAANTSESAVMPKASESERDQAVDAVEWHNPPSIEQLTTDYHAKAAEADRLQSVADEALKAADDALIALEKAGELLGLVISIDTKPKQAEQPAQPQITDWRDLRIGDVIELTGSYNHCWKEHAGREMTVKNVYPSHGDNDDQVDLLGESGSWSLGGNTIWRFIRRP